MKAPKPTQMTNLLYLRNGKTVEIVERNKPRPLMFHIKKQKKATGNYDLGILTVKNI